MPGFDTFTVQVGWMAQEDVFEVASRVGIEGRMNVPRTRGSSWEPVIAGVQLQVHQEFKVS